MNDLLNQIFSPPARATNTAPDCSPESVGHAASTDVSRRARKTAGMDRGIPVLAFLNSYQHLDAAILVHRNHAGGRRRRSSLQQQQQHDRRQAAAADYYAAVVEREAQQREMPQQRNPLAPPWLKERAKPRMPARRGSAVLRAPDGPDGTKGFASRRRPSILVDSGMVPVRVGLGLGKISRDARSIATTESRQQTSKLAAESLQCSALRTPPESPAASPSPASSVEHFCDDHLRSCSALHFSNLIE